MKVDFNEMVLEEMPEYKVMNNGIESLTSVELIALILGGGYTNEKNIRMARQLMNMADDLFGLREMRTDEMEVVQGISQRKAIAIKAAVEIGRRLTAKRNQREAVLSAADIYEHMRPYLAGLDHEEGYIILMSQHFGVLATKRISVGGITETAIDVRQIVKEAVMVNATVVALIHNHPSGGTTPSREDDRITERVKRACDMMRLYLLDHVIYGDSGYYSYRDNGRL